MNRTALAPTSPLLRSHGVARWLGVALALGALLCAPRLGSAAPAGVDKARAAFAASDYPQARSELDALGAAGSEPAALLLRARLELWTGRYAEAVTTGTKAGRSGGAPKVEAAAWIAEALARQGKVDEAIAVVRAVEKEPGSARARLVLGDLLIGVGKRAEAEPVLMTIVDDYNQDRIRDDDAEGLSLVGRAAHLLRRPKSANEAFNLAERVGGRKRVETLLWRAELFLDKYDPGHAAQVVKEALVLAPNDPRARVAMAHVKLEQAMDFAAAEQEVRKALGVDPKLADAFFVRAGLALRTMDLAAAAAAADEGLKHNPRDLDLLSIRAAERFLADDRAGVAALEKQVLALDPEHSRFYLVVGEFAEWEHRYDDIVTMMRQAVAVDDRDAKAHAALGLNLIRAGDEQAGLEELRKAWRRDEYNVRVYNTLNLYEDTIAKDYVTVDGTTFRIRYPKKDKPILARYAPRLLETAWASMVKRYAFQPKTPVGIELYADPEHFSVRTSGLPNVGIQGVCFGKTLAALSPTAGPFNWGMILWHELAHVFAIDRSRSRVPRWYTEGLSEYETLKARPEWRREDDLALYRGLRDGKIPKVADFNRAFTHAENPEDITTAYFAASQIMVFLVERFGFDRVVSALPLFAQSKPTPEVVQTALGVSADELDQRFREWLTPRLERYAKQYVPNLRPPESVDKAREELATDPRNPAKLVTLALGLLADDQRAEAEATLTLALSIAPKQRDALYVRLKLALDDDQLDGARALVTQLVAAGADGYVLRMKAADLAEARKQPAELKAELWAAHRWDPTQAEPLQALVDLARKDKDADAELEGLRMLAQVDQHDRRVWARLLGGLVAKGRWEEARTVGESALYVAVDDPEVHRLYARALARTGQFVSAIFELNSAIVAGAEPKDAAEIYRSMAQGYRKLRKPEYAERAEALARAAASRSQPAGGPDDGASLRPKPAAMPTP